MNPTFSPELDAFEVEITADFLTFSAVNPDDPDAAVWLGKRQGALRCDARGTSTNPTNDSIVAAAQFWPRNWQNTVSGFARSVPS